MKWERTGGEPETLECGCVARPIEVISMPTNTSMGTGWEVLEPCPRHARCPVCGGPRPGGADHTRCTTNGYEGLDYRL